MMKKARASEMMIVGAVLLLGLGFAAYTQHVWEDYWITFRASRNLAMGNGLVYTVGERLHTFTSPLGALLPALFSWITGNHNDSLSLWLFRIVSVTTLGAAVTLLFQSLKTLQLRPVSFWLTLGLIGLDAKILDFSINGMETGLLIFFAALTVHSLLVEGPRQRWRMGVGWAGLMWTRPDGCVYIAALALGSLLFFPRKNSREFNREHLKKLLVAALICTILYLPWFLWAWWYYGSPVPHTIIAKGTNEPPLHLSSLLTGLLKFPGEILFSYGASVPFTFMPDYATMGGWPETYSYLCWFLGTVAAFAWIIPILRPQTRLFSLVYFLGNFYLTEVLKYVVPWYLPIVALFGYLTLGLLFDQVLGLTLKFPQFGWNRGWFLGLPCLLQVSAVGLLLGQLFITICTARELRVQQALIENGLRRPIGLWLREHARTPHDTVMLEPVGYIGYYSGLKMLDYPGLVSTKMVEVRQRLGLEKQDLACRELKPDWLVLRPASTKGGAFVDAATLKNDYQLVKLFDATDKINAVHWLPGRPYLRYDETFLVFHRKDEIGKQAANQIPAQSFSSGPRAHRKFLSANNSSANGI